MWIPLEQLSSAPAERIGHKALRLAEAQVRGLPIPESFVLPGTELARMREEPALAEEWADALLRVMGPCERALLRSSSPLEDRPESSAAGLLPTISRALRADAIADGLREMGRAAEASSLRTLLGTGQDPVPLAVLAQPRLELELWCTLEWDPERDSARIEGRQLDSCGDHPLPLETVSLEGGDTLSESGVGIGALLELARRAQEGSEGVWLLELGLVAGEAVLLQRRPVAAPAPRSDELEEWSEFPVFASDRRGDWEWDAAHSPRPLAPLLASLFVDWIRERGEEHPSRIIDGRWHDRRAQVGNKTGDPAAARRDASPEEENASELRGKLREWHEERIPGLERGLELVEMLAADCREYASWRLFVVAWLDWQTKYYDGAASRLRRLILPFAAEDAEPLPVAETAARRRERELDLLAGHWPDWDESARADRLGEFLDEHGHLGPGGWDGYGVPWDEDPAPLIREVERRSASMAGDSTARSNPLEGVPGVPEKDAPVEEWVAHALAALEDDDELLAYAYALFRDAALNLEEQLWPEAGDGEILDILESDLAHLESEPSAEAWQEARARGARHRARWEAALPSEAPPASEGESLHGNPRLCQGESKGNVRVLENALENGGPESGEILVVPTILPADALVFSRCAGLICESGEVLGHASVLAREQGIPALVVPQACSRLRGVERVHLDASAGVVRVLSQKESE